jgi:uncharacterized protein YaaN involved in tellurite resistance
MAAAQALRDVQAAGEDLERRVHDLRLTRQVALQSLPGIRMVQENDKALLTRIDSTLINTVPLWKNQLAQAVTIYRMSAAADSVRRAADLTNDLLEANARTMRDGNAHVREQMERGIFDIETIRRANDTLIAAINESLEIARKGRAAREQALAELRGIESRLLENLVNAGSKTGVTGSRPSLPEVSR